MVREAVESRWGRHPRRRCCAANPPLGPWCVLRAVGEAVPGLGQLLCGSLPPPGWRHQRGGEGEEDVVVLALGEGKVGVPEGWQGEVPVLSRAAPGDCCQHAGDAGPGPPVPSLRERTGEGGGARVPVLAPRLLRSFFGIFLMDCYLSHTFPSVPSRSDDQIFLHVSSFNDENCFKSLMKAATQC